MAFTDFLPISSFRDKIRATTFFVPRCLLNDNSGIRDMNRQSHYLDKARACADAAKEAHDPGERIALLQLSQRFILLAEHAARCQEHRTNWVDQPAGHATFR